MMHDACRFGRRCLALIMGMTNWVWMLQVCLVQALMDYMLSQTVLQVKAGSETPTQISTCT
jgi:hypothetical protein